MAANFVIETKRISDLNPAPYNPRQSTAKQEANLKASLEKFGVVEPVVYNKQTGNIVGGHFRVRELKKMGVQEVPCVVVDLSVDDEKELNIRLNANTGQWDWESLANEWDEVKLEEWGLELPVFDEPKELEAEEDEYEIPDEIQTDIVLGDLFEIGEHRLLCGDSTDSDAVAKLMDGEKADIVFTSPPYNLGSNVSLSTRGETDNAYTTYNDSQSEEKYNELLQGFTNSFWGYCNYLIVNIQSLAGNKKSVIDYQYIYRNNISDISVWVKSNPQPAMAKNVMNSAFEYFIYINTGDNVTRAINTGDFRGTFSNVYNGTVNSENNVKEHKAAFSTLMCADFLKTFSKASVIDCFMGTGSTMVAAHQLNRKCYGMELDPKYCQVIIDRMIKLDPTLTIKRNGKPYQPVALETMK